MRWMKETVLSRRFWLGAKKYSPIPSSLSVTVVIPAWNEEDFISRTIESILTQEYPCDILVVNDYSTDNTSNIAKSYDTVKVIDVDKNQGSKAQALNCAIPHIDTDIFVCVDADTILKPDSLGNLMTAFNNESVMIASGFVTSKYTKDTFWHYARSGEYILGQYVTKSAQENLNNVLVAAGCFFGIRTEYLKKHQFDNATMAEDMDLTWKAMADGHNVVFVENAICVVNDPIDWNTYQNQVNRWFSGLFQNLKIRRFNLFKYSVKLAITAYLYIFFTMFAFPSIILMFFYIPETIISFLLYGYTLLLITAIIYGISNKTYMFKYPMYVACMILIAPINYYLFIKCAINELILNNKLDTWVKGH